ncbi:MAG: sphingomyelin phosphodiesterase [Bacteriovoracia bacterium]
MPRKYFVALLLGALLAVPGADAAQLSILTYNVFGLPAPVGGKAAKAKWRFAEIAARLGDYDVVALQEAWDKPTADLIKKSDLPHHATGPKPQQLFGGNGLITLSRYPIVKKGFREFRDCTGFDCFAKKGVLWTRLNLGAGRALDVYNTHLNAWDKGIGGDEGMRVRMSQIMELGMFIWQNSSGVPFVLMGDMNAEADSPEYERIRALTHGVDVYRVANGASGDPEIAHGPTYVAGENSWIPDFMKAFVKPQRIDYIWVSGARDLKVREARRNYMLVDHDGERVNLSDHFGVETEIDI